MTVALWRVARSSSFSRSTASSASATRCLQRDSYKYVSLRAISLMHRQPNGGQQPLAAGGDVNASCCFSKRIRTNRISTTGLHRKSALPVSSIDGSSNSTPFLLADIGEGISEVEILQWFASPGDTVAQFDLICEVQTDKANVDITSRFDGVVESLCGQVGDMISVGKPLMYITTESGGGGVAETEEPNQKPQQVDQPTMTLNNVDSVQDRLRIPSVGTNYSSYCDETSDTEHAAPEITSQHLHRQANSKAKVLTSPAVRKLSKDNSIDIGSVLGTGPGGRVLKADILKIISPTNDTASSTLSQETLTAPITLTPPPEDAVVVPIRGYNRLMVKSMTSSLEIPHMMYADEINVNALTEVRDALRPLAQDLGIPKLTYMPFFVKAASLALVKHPAINSTIDTQEMTLTYHKGHNIGVAVDTERGLAVPVVKGCEEKSVLEIAVELGRLYSLAAVGNLAREDVSNPTFTLSNIGAIGGTYMSPVVIPPQVAIGAMGKIQRLPRFVDDDSDKVEAVRIMPMSWGGDHRAVDGATMARFSNLWKTYCENPSSMMFAMR